MLDGKSDKSNMANKSHDKPNKQVANWNPIGLELQWNPIDVPTKSLPAIRCHYKIATVAPTGESLARFMFWHFLNPPKKTPAPRPPRQKPPPPPPRSKLWSNVCCQNYIKAEIADRSSNSSSSCCWQSLMCLAGGGGGCGFWLCGGLTRNTRDTFPSAAT